MREYEPLFLGPIKKSEIIKITLKPLPPHGFAFLFRSSFQVDKAELSNIHATETRDVSIFFLQPNCRSLLYSFEQCTKFFLIIQMRSCGSACDIVYEARYISISLREKTNTLLTLTNKFLVQTKIFSVAKSALRTDSG